MIDELRIETGRESQEQLRIEYWKLDRLIPYAGNARTHSASQIAEIAGSIRAFGFSNPILVGAEGDMIAGHGRLAVARQLRMAQVPVIVLYGLTDVQRRSLILADNRIGLNSGWDLKMLACEMKDLSLLGADLKALGFKKGELAIALRPDVAGLTDENAVPDCADAVASMPGDIWVLGQHRVACGDCSDLISSGLFSTARHRTCSYRIHPTVSSMIRSGGTGSVLTNPPSAARSRTMSAPIGRRPGLFSPVR